MGGGVEIGVGLALTVVSLRCLLWLTGGEVSKATGAPVLGSQGETGPQDGDLKSLANQRESKSPGCTQV